MKKVLLSTTLKKQQNNKNKWHRPLKMRRNAEKARSVNFFTITFEQLFSTTENCLHKNQQQQVYKQQRRGRRVRAATHGIANSTN